MTQVDGETRLQWDGHTTKACFLSIVARQSQAFCFVFDDIGSDRRVMGDLLHKELSDATSIGVWPSAVKDSVQTFYVSKLQ
jgi:hypothetical protein